MKTKLVLLAGILVAGGVGAYFWQRPEVPEPPTVDLADADPPLVRAIAEARAEVQRSPRSAPAWGRLGSALLANENRPEAVACFACAERLDPRDPRWPYLQVVRMVTNDPESIRKLTRAVELTGPRPTTPRLRLAEALLGQGNGTEAEAHFRTVLQVEPQNPRAQLGLARMAYEKGRPDESLALLRQVADNPYVQKVAHALLAEVQQARGDRGAAEVEARAALQLPEDRSWPDPFLADVERLGADRVALDRAASLAEQGNLPEAVGTLRRLTNSYPDWGEAWLQLGLALNQAGDRPAGEQALRKAVAAAPRLAKAHFSLGTALLEQRRSQEAEACFRTALDLQPNYARALYNLNLCQQNRGDREAAMASLRRALQCQPNFPEAESVLGQLLAASGHKDEALVHLRAALRQKPDDVKTKKALDALH
jgi:tetratricopeptide (TPR) repeat protein